MASVHRYLVVGMNPSSYSSPTNGKEKKNHTFDRLYRWFDYAGVDYFSFVNCSDKVGEITLSDVDYDTLNVCLKYHTHVFALGGFSSSVLKRLNRSHIVLPHPSPRNRKFNDPKFEPLLMKELKEYMETL